MNELSVLLIEDNAGDARLVREYLGERFGDACRLHAAATLADGLAWLDRQRADVVLLDLSLPDSSGLDTYHRLREQAPHTPVVVLSGHDDDELALAAVRAGADDYLAKQQAGAVGLARALRHALERRRSAQGSADERLAQLQAQIEQLQLFSSSVAHDLRSPLNAVLGHAWLLETDGGAALTADQKRQLRSIAERAREMTQLIEGQLALARIDRDALERRPVDLSALAVAIVRQLHQHEPKRPMAVEIEPQLEASGDPALLRCLLDNLIGNAWKYTGRAERPRLRFGLAAGAPGETVYVVQDNGVGFDMRDSARLFQPFERLATGRDFKGSGVGLASARRIVERHGGRIWAESEPGNGSSFYFTLAAAA